MKRLIALCLILLAGCTSTDKTEEPLLQIEPAGYDLFSWDQTDIYPSHVPFFGFSFRLPEAWTYRVITEDENPSGSLWVEICTPEDTDNPLITITASESTGVCGTGLVQKEIWFNGYNALAGYYDEHTVWDFIYLTGDLEGCMILNNDLERSVLYEEDLNRILSTVSFTYYEGIPQWNE